jgi:branched-chain amino acid transport system permease protein
MSTPRPAQNPIGVAVHRDTSTTLGVEAMLDILLIAVIGGVGTLYGAVLGSVLFVLAQNYLQDLLKLGQGALQGVPLLAALVSPDRWLLWLGLLFVLSVHHFPSGLVGRLRAGKART